MIGCPYQRAQQIVGRERRERVSQLAWCGEGGFDSRRRVNSTVMPPRHSLLVNNAMKWVEILPEYIKAAALVVGAGWAYWKFIYQRQREPATDIDIDLRFVGVQKEKWTSNKPIRR